MESQAARSLGEIKAAAHKNTVEILFLSIERKAEENPEKTEEGKMFAKVSSESQESVHFYLFTYFSNY